MHINGDFGNWVKILDAGKSPNLIGRREVAVRASDSSKMRILGGHFSRGKCIVQNEISKSLKKIIFFFFRIWLLSLPCINFLFLMKKKKILLILVDY